MAKVRRRKAGIAAERAITSDFAGTSVFSSPSICYGATAAQPSPRRKESDNHRGPVGASLAARCRWCSSRPRSSPPRQSRTVIRQLSG